MEIILLPISLIKKYDMTITRENVEYLFDEFQVLNYKWRNIKFPSITPSYEVKYSSYIPVKVDPVGRFVELTLDTKSKIDKFNLYFVKVLKSLTKEELIYYHEKYQRFNSEEQIARKMHRSRNGLVHIRDSLILKVALAFNEEVKC